MWSNYSLRELLMLMTSCSIISLLISYNFLRTPQIVITSDEQSLPTVHLQKAFSLLEKPAVQEVLKDLETRQLSWNGSPRITLCGDHEASHFNYYADVLEQKGFRLERNGTGDVSDWTVLLCLAHEDCCSSSVLTNTEAQRQKVNVIPGMADVLYKKAELCKTVTLLHKATSQYLAAPCFKLPESRDEFFNAAKTSPPAQTWLFTPSLQDQQTQYFSTTEFFDRNFSAKRLSGSAESLVQMMMRSPLTVDGCHISIHVFLLVTSVVPLRAYVYDEGLVFFKQPHQKSKKRRDECSSKWWLLSQLWRYLTARKDPVKDCITRIDKTLAQLLLGAEPGLLVHVANFPSRSTHRCTNCFQLLEAELLLNSTLCPWLLGFREQHSIYLRNYSTAMEQDLMADTFNLIFSNKSVYSDVSRGLRSLATLDNIGIAGIECSISHELCLTLDDLSYLLAARREGQSLNTGRFRRLYPVTDVYMYNDYLKTIQQLMLQDPANVFQAGNVLLRKFLGHSTADLHLLIVKLEEYYASSNGGDEVYQQFYQTEFTNTETHHKSIGNTSQQLGNLQVKTDFCSKDKTLKPYLNKLLIMPEIKLKPSFSSLWTEYKSDVDYLITMVHITAMPVHCNSHVRFEHHSGAINFANFTLGLGSNTVLILVVENNSGTVLSIYTILIFRHSSAHREPPYNPKTMYHACKLRQECEYVVFPGENCGLQKDTSYFSWAEFIMNISQLPICQSGDALGRWLVPCSNCSDRSSCVWSKIQWQPYMCFHSTLNRLQLNQCLKGKKLLFLGDSTNRGMMHYIMERLNGSLSISDKTHHIRVYPDLNNGHTTLSFAYYPQFWLQAPQRPVFDKALYNLLLRSQPLKNSTETIIIVGGVQWLGTHHLHAMLRALRREGLQGAQVVVKTLGCGFHIPAEGVHYITKVQQEKLTSRSRSLAAFAQYHHMEVLDTFNMTAARFRDFLQGKCACHFHRVDENRYGSSGKLLGYHVEGPINAAYTNILLSRLCTLSNKPSPKRDTVS